MELHPCWVLPKCPFLQGELIAWRWILILGALPVPPGNWQSSPTPNLLHSLLVTTFPLVEWHFQRGTQFWQTPPFSLQISRWLQHCSSCSIIVKEPTKVCNGSRSYCLPFTVFCSWSFGSRPRSWAKPHICKQYKINENNSLYFTSRLRVILVFQNASRRAGGEKKHCIKNSLGALDIIFFFWNLIVQLA